MAILSISFSNPFFRSTERLVIFTRLSEVLDILPERDRLLARPTLGRVWQPLEQQLPGRAFHSLTRGPKVAIVRGMFRLVSSSSNCRRFICVTKPAANAEVRNDS